MESVRWVLGESSAKEMRADAMDAVIFNGSGNRKAISRASVELVFDNSLGGASGEWSQYAEISVKRVIERDKGSTYYINNSVVRRRDVADLFLGTGLGGRAYAIIGQNTISRIVEAKPEEMRVFLEEAAGVSKYKERRRETELRLRDTRENLTRVEDILRELDKQILRLQSQAAVAEEYHRLQGSLNLTNGQIWVLKKRDAGAMWEKAQRQVEKLVNALESQMADLRHSENLLETIRQQHALTTDAVNTAQASYYEANAAVSNLENQVKNTADARERLQLQLQQFNAQLEKNWTQQTDVDETLKATQAHLTKMHVEFADSESEIEHARQAVALRLQQYQAALATFNASQSTWLNTEQRSRLETANIAHITRTIGETEEQIKRLQQSLSALQMPKDDALREKALQLSDTELNMAQAEALSKESLADERNSASALKAAREHAHLLQRELHVLEAEINSLNKIQQSMREDHQSNLSMWIKQYGLHQNPRIWQSLRIQPGWETALEAVLGARLNAITHEGVRPGVRAPAAASLALTEKLAGASLAVYASSALQLLYAKIEHMEAGLAPVIQDWLKGVYLLDSDEDPIDASLKLQEGECLVNRQGDIYTRYSVTYYGAQSFTHGILERQARLGALEAQLPKARDAFEAVQQEVLQLDAKLVALRKHQHTQQDHLKHLTQQAHQLNLALQQLKQQQANTLQRKTLLEADIALAEQKLQSLLDEKNNKQSLIGALAADLLQMQKEKSVNEANKNAAEVLLNEFRDRQQATERSHQEKHFNIKIINNKINELKSRVEFLNEEKSSLKLRHSEVEATLSATKMETLKANLETALNVKQTCELSLANARNALSESQETLLQHERTRMQQEQLLHPLRDKLEASRLAEQEARLHFEQCQAALASSAIQEPELVNSLAGLESEIKVSQLERKKEKLEFDIEALGAVNLAAIEELANEQARKQYLDSQHQDLTEASQTLEDAIRKIDRETRSRLQLTFDEANKHFNELFTTLFGGGQARLELLGEEILDTGIQVFAQPPGKKNSTIHLLSGGEKALTALALVFALFRLNPAPFCLMDEVDAPLDDSNTERFCAMVKKMSERTQFLYVSHNKITMEMAQQLIGVTMQESGVSRIVDVDMEAAVRMVESIS